jgi:hypothetical protein
VSLHECVYVRARVPVRARPHEAVGAHLLAVTWRPRMHVYVRLSLSMYWLGAWACMWAHVSIYGDFGISGELLTARG